MGQNSTVTKREFMDGLDKLQECFPNMTTLTSETVKRYWEYLNTNFTSAEFSAAIEKIIITERFFPPISVFFKYKGQSTFQKAF